MEIKARTLNSLERQLCDIQGRLFERSLLYNLDSADFIKTFMNSETCRFIDLPYDRLHWVGEESILDELLDESSVKPLGVSFSKDELFWIGYIYRYWHFLTGESGVNIYSQAKAELMRDSYLGFHTMDVIMAIEDFKEIHRLQ
jgi:hypothetical protein